MYKKWKIRKSVENEPSSKCSLSVSRRIINNVKSDYERRALCSQYYYVLDHHYVLDVDFHNSIKNVHLPYHQPRRFQLRRHFLCEILNESMIQN